MTQTVPHLTTHVVGMAPVTTALSYNADRLISAANGCNDVSIMHPFDGEIASTDAVSIILMCPDSRSGSESA